MRRLTYIILCLAALYAGYWVIGANRVTNGVETALRDMQSDGWTADAAVKTRGFPSRFDTTLSDVVLADPAGQMSYEADFVQTLAISYRPNKARLVMPPEQRVGLAGINGVLRADTLQASVAIKPNVALSFDNVTAQGSALEFAADDGWTLGIDALLAAARVQPDNPSRYDVYGKADMVRLPGQGGVIATIIADTQVGLAAPLDRTTRDVLVAQIVVNDLRLVWNDVTLAGEGQLDVDAAGRPEGQIALRIENWRAVIPRLVEAGVINPDFASTALTLGALQAAGQETMRVPLTYKDGFATLGPLPLGPAPILHFRATE